MKSNNEMLLDNAIAVVKGLVEQSGEELTCLTCQFKQHQLGLGALRVEGIAWFWFKGMLEAPFPW